MANLLFIDVLSNRVTVNYNKMRKLIWSIDNEWDVRKTYANKQNYFFLTLF